LEIESMALTATEQKEIRAMILGMVDRGWRDEQIDIAVKVAVSAYTKLKAAAAQPAVVVAK
jgi:hypothetical protein